MSKVRPSTQFAQDGATTGQALVWDGSKWAPSTATTLFWQDRLLATGAGTIMTLGATPVTNSLLVWKNGTLLAGGGVDYTLSGAAVTFTAAFANTDVIRTWYSYTGSSSTATLTYSLLVADDFTAANTADISGRTTPTGSKTWVKRSTSTTAVGITSNKAAITTSGGNGAYIVDTGVVDMDASADLTFQSDQSLIIRGNTTTAIKPELLCQLTTSGRRIAKIDGSGTYTILASDAVACTNGTTYTVRGVAHGNSITMYVNGTSILTYTLTGAETTTYVSHGAGLSGDATGAAWDNFSVSVG